MKRLSAGRSLCGNPHDDLPESVSAHFQGGHITAAQFAQLPPEIQAQINPHEVESNPNEGPIIFD